MGDPAQVAAAFAETVRALGEDLASVVAETAPEGSPVIVAGHSMGGMTVMAFAGLHPELLGEKVVGAVLVSTSSGQLRGFTVPGEKWIVKALKHVPLRPGRLVTLASQRRGGFGIDPRDEDVRAARDQIAATRAQVTLELVAAVRNKGVDAFNEIMRMQI